MKPLLTSLTFSLFLWVPMHARQAPDVARETKDKPNFILIFTDDQGYGDLGCFGSKTIRTASAWPVPSADTCS